MPHLYRMWQVSPARALDEMLIFTSIPALIAGVQGTLHRKSSNKSYGRGFYDHRAHTLFPCLLVFRTDCICERRQRDFSVFTGNICGPLHIPPKNESMFYVLRVLCANSPSRFTPLPQVLMRVGRCNAQRQYPQDREHGVEGMAVAADMLRVMGEALEEVEVLGGGKLAAVTNDSQLALILTVRERWGPRCSPD